MSELNVVIRFVAPEPPKSALVTFTPAADKFLVPCPADTLLGTVEVSPSDWVGDLTLAEGQDFCVLRPVASSKVIELRTTVEVTVAGDHSVIFDAVP